MNVRPLRTSDESVRGVGSGGSEEGSAPGGQVVERESWRSGNDAIEFLREVLSSLEALTTTSRTAKVV